MRYPVEFPNVRALMRRFGLHPDKRLGQNFLIEKSSLEKVVEVANLSGGETVLEIGAGLGSLTVLLSASAQKVIAVELDKRLIPALELSIGHLDNVHLIVGDILKLDIVDLLDDQAYFVIANIPYNITSVLIRHLMENRYPPERIVLTLQREVAQRIIAVPGEFNLLALSVQVYGTPKIAGHIPSSAFYPEPKVDSSIICIQLHPSPIVTPELLSTFFQLAKMGFNQKRKQLANSLAAGLGINKEQVRVWLIESKIDPHSRPQEIELLQWVRLAETISNPAADPGRR
jgi:16S rRNA (adenine1518-N6/adenine1519-N6)-dimethyltransferase